MALCPQCDHSVLVHTLLTDNLAAYSCGKCLGTLVSLVAYRAWRESAAGRDAAARHPARGRRCRSARFHRREEMSEVPLADEQVPHQRRQDQSPRLLPALRRDLARRRRVAAGRGPGARGRFHARCSPRPGSTRCVPASARPWKNSACASCWAATTNGSLQFAEWLQTQPAQAGNPGATRAPQVDSAIARQLTRHNGKRRLQRAASVRSLKT